VYPVWDKGITTHLFEREKGAAKKAKRGILKQVQERTELPLRRDGRGRGAKPPLRRRLRKYAGKTHLREGGEKGQGLGSSPIKKNWSAKLRGCRRERGGAVVNDMERHLQHIDGSRGNLRPVKKGI